jgi:hypothetical protein
MKMIMKVAKHKNDHERSGEWLRVVREFLQNPIRRGSPDDFGVVGRTKGRTSELMVLLPLRSPATVKLERHMLLTYNAGVYRRVEES